MDEHTERIQTVTLPGRFLQILARRGRLYRQCAWCSRFQSAIGSFIALPRAEWPSEDVSHTCCPRCRRAVLEEIAVIRGEV